GPVEAGVIAQDLTVCGRVKGTIRAVRVKLQDGGAVEGDIFHRSLSIDENSLFEGSSRRVENPTEEPSSQSRTGCRACAISIGSSCCRRGGAAGTAPPRGWRGAAAGHPQVLGRSKGVYCNLVRREVARLAKQAA